MTEEHKFGGNAFEHEIPKGQSEHYEDDSSNTRKGKGIYCSLPTIAFTILTVGVLITAAALMAHYIPRLAETVPTNAPVVDPIIPLMRGRLPKTVLPRRYEVKLRPFLYDDDVPYSRLRQRFTFDGWVRIKVECIEPTHEITLHSKKITLHGMPVVTSVSTLDKKTDIFESFKMVEEYAFMVLKLKKMMNPHQEYDIYMEYSGILGDDEAGFYPSMYLDPSNNTRYIATTQMEGPHARRVFPCFDEPSFKATYDVQLEHRTDMQALANGMETGTETIDSHWSRTSFKSVPFIPTYLLAFIVHDYSSISVTNNHGCLIRVWCQSDLINLAPYALNVSDFVQTYFDDYLDYRYPLAKQDHIAIQDFGAGAMENWGLITYQDYYLLYGMEEISTNEFYSLIITHELAHQWFGNLVTTEWWNDLWLNEGFATYMEHIGMDFVHPEFRKFETFYVDTIDRALSSDSLGSMPAIRAPVYATDEHISSQFSTITYQKGGSMLWMLEHFLTIDVFNRGIKSYLKKRAYKNSNAEHLWRELTAADKDDGKNDVKTIMDTWTLQRGYPLVTLTRTGNDIKATQKIFLQIDKTLETEEYGNLGYKWYVPLTYMYKSGPPNQYDKPKSIWMDPADDKTTFSLPTGTPTDDWYLANAKMASFYRVNYDQTNWERLLKQAEDDPDVFSEENKIGLLYDSENLANAGVIDMEIYQGFAKSLENNTIVTRRAVLRTSSRFARMLMGRNHFIKRRSSSPSAVKAYMQRLVEPLYTESGWDTNFIPDLPTTRKRSRIDVTSTACLYGNGHCVSKATNQFNEYMNNPSYNVIPNFRQVVYCNGIRFGGQSEWYFAWNMLQKSDDRLERSRWINALSCSVDTSHLQSYLQSTLDSTTFNRRDAQLILMGVAETHNGYEVAWDFLRNNWEEVEKMFKRKSQLLCNIFEEITSYFNTQEQLQELLDFGQTRNLGALKYTYKAAITSTEANIRWMANNADQMEEWLASVINEE